MSPCESLSCTQTLRYPWDFNGLYRQSSLSSNGFLPEHPPLESLPDPYYDPWETLIIRLPSLLEDNTLREHIDKLPILLVDHLGTESEKRRAYVVLCFLAHGYIWGCEKASEILPPPITVPLLQVSSLLSLPPVATYASLNLWNFRTLSPTSDLRDLDTIQSLHTFTGTEDESWFYAVSIAIEAQGAAVIPAMLRALAAASSQDWAAVSPTLGELTRCIDHLGVLLDRMDERCNPTVFYHRIRPFLAGSKNMAAAGLPLGVFYDQGNGRGEWCQLRGGSNGQSSLIQLFDIVLGVEHTSGGTSGGCEKAPSFHEEVRSYMPGPHRRFLEHVAESFPGGIRKALGLASDDLPTIERMECLGAFKAAAKALAAFRGKHLQMVTRYIIIPSREGCGRSGQVVNLATASSDTRKMDAGDRKVELVGTGGTALVPFLKESRDETARAGEVRGCS